MSTLKLESRGKVGFAVLAVFVYFSLHSQPGSGCCHAQDSTDGWVSEAQSEWEAYKKYSASIKSGHTRFESSAKINGENVRFGGESWRALVGRNKSSWVVEDSRSIETVYCTNEKYRFHLQRPKGDDVWVLKELHFVQDDSELNFDNRDEAKDDVLRKLSRRKSSSYMIFNENLDEIVHYPSFKTVKVDQEVDGVTLVHCTFDIYSYKASGLLHFSSPDWRLTRCDLDLVPNGNTNAREKYEKTIDYNDEWLPILKREKRYVVETGEVYETGSVEIDYLNIRQKQPGDFRLSYFGLPEPEGVRWGLPLAIWLSLLGVSMVLAVGFFRWFRAHK